LREGGLVNVSKHLFFELCGISIIFKTTQGGAFKMSDCIFEKMQENEKTIVKL